MASSRASQEKRCCGGSCGVDFTRFLDAGCMALFSIVLSCVFLLMFGETLRMINRTEFAHKDYVKRFLTRLFPFRSNFEFNLTHALLFTLSMLLLSFRLAFLCFSQSAMILLWGSLLWGEILSSQNGQAHGKTQ